MSNKICFRVGILVSKVRDFFHFLSLKYFKFPSNFHPLLIEWVKLNRMNFAFGRKVTSVSFTLIDLSDPIMYTSLTTLQTSLNSSTFPFTMVMYQLFLAFLMSIMPLLYGITSTVAAELVIHMFGSSKLILSVMPNKITILSSAAAKI
jgi:hypothetical protein